MCISFSSPPYSCNNFLFGGLIINNIMKHKIDWIYYITILCLIVTICICISKLCKLQDRVDYLEDKTLSIELRLEDIYPNDDLV